MKRLSIILCMVLCCCRLYAQLSTETISPNIDWYVNNIKSDTYHISTAAELVGFAALVNGTTGSFSAYDFSDKTIVLDSDIDLGCTVDTLGSLVGYKWTAIGKNYSTRFAGTFDGNGFCITGMIIKAEEDEIGALFGYSSGTIKNVTIAGGYICADYYGASICSHNSGLIVACINTSNIICNNYGGGICGKNYENGQIIDCYNFGNVAQRNFCGGILGSNSLNKTIVTNCVYDKQMCPISVGCGTMEVRNIKALTTSQILSGEGYIIDDKIKLETGMYPKNSNTQWTNTSRAALTPINMSEMQHVNNLIKDFNLPKNEGVVYETSSTQSLTIENNVASPQERADVQLRIKGGKCVKFINLRITNNQLKINGNEHAPLRIANYNDFIKFANAVNYCTDFKGYANINGFEGVSIVLTDNVKIPDGVNFKPIGNKITPFKGIFTGYGFCISNLNIRYPLNRNCGLFGYNEGTIQKVVVVGGKIIGGNYTGAICGFNSKGTIQKCISSIAVRGHYYTGGICGFNNEGQIIQTINVNSVEGIENSEGGICGYSIGGKLNYCVYDKQMCLLENAVGQTQENTELTEVKGLLTEEMIGRKLESKQGFSFDFQYEDDMYPKIVSVVPHPDSEVASTPIFLAKNENVQNITSFITMTEKENVSYKCNQNDVLKITKDKALPLKQGSVIFSVTNGKVEKKIIVKITSKMLEQIGTRDNPLIIASYEDIKEFCQAVNNNTDYKGFACIDGFSNVYFKIQKNIQCPTNINQMPSGNYLFPFKGVLDGNGHTISGFYCDRKDADNIGFIGYNSGLICNLKLSRSPISGRYYTGGICGFNNGEIFNCQYDSSSVTGSNYTGGIAGYSKGSIASSRNYSAVKGDYFAGGISGENTGRIDSCANHGIISGSSSIGGISGSCAGGDIQTCNNYGSIHGVDNTGGIAGKNSYASISECFNYGELSGGDCTGGICGLNEGTVIKCENKGAIFANITIGGIVGRGGKVYFCINRGSISGKGNNSAGIIGACKNNSEIKYCVNYGEIKAAAFAGGTCADNAGGKITSCVNFGTIISSYYVGGICGYNSGQLNSCIFYGNLDGSSYTGAICGRENAGSAITSCFFDNQKCEKGGIDNRDVEGKAVGMTRNMMLGDKMKDMLKYSDYIFITGEVPMPKMR